MNGNFVHIVVCCEQSTVAIHKNIINSRCPFLNMIFFLSFSFSLFLCHTKCRCFTFTIVHICVTRIANQHEIRVQLNHFSMEIIWKVEHPSLSVFFVCVVFATLAVLVVVVQSFQLHFFSTLFNFLSVFTGNWSCLRRHRRTLSCWCFSISQFMSLKKYGAFNNIHLWKPVLR